MTANKNDIRLGASGNLVLRSVSKSYGNVPALRGISLEIKQGEFIALLGPSGCGKTTLLGSIAGFTDIDSGEIEIDGQRLSRATPPYERNLGVVFQQYALFPHMPVRQNIAFPLEIRRLPPAIIGEMVDKALAMVDLGPYASRFPRELSGGQQQRVALARALVYSPPVLLLDEPLGALDRRLRDAMQAELKDLHRRLGTTFVYVTHDQDEALAMADRVVIMRGGLIEQVGTPFELYERPKTEFVAKFVGECNVFEAAVSMQGGSTVLRDEKSGALLHVGPGAERGGKVAIRPEWIQVAPAGTPDANGVSVQARLVQDQFHGSDTLLTFETSLGVIQARISHAARRGLDLGASVFSLTWDPRATVTVEAAPGKIENLAEAA